MEETIKKLKSDLEAERQRAKQLQREKAHDVRQAKQEASRERDRAIAEAAKRLNAEHAAEREALRDALARQKEHDIRHALKAKDEEMRQVREQLAREKTTAIRHAAAGARRETMEAFRDQVETDRAKSMEELWTLREAKTRLEDEVRVLRDAERESVDATRRLRLEFEAERDALLRKSKQDAARDAQQIRLAERIVQQKEREALLYQQQAKQLVVEKETIGDELTRFREAESWEKRSAAKNDSIVEGMEREMMIKTNRYRDQMRLLEEKIAALKTEYANLKRGSADKDHEEKVKRLRQRNKELVALARRLEDQNKSLKDSNRSQSNSDSNRELEAYKRSVARERAKEQAEHARVLSAKKRERDELAERLAKKERELHQATTNKGMRVDSVDELVKVREKVESLENLMKAMAKEKLHFERNLTENPTSAAQLQNLQVRFDALEHNKKQLDATLAKRNADVAELREKVARMEEKERDLQAAVQKLASDNSRLEAELELCVTSRADLERRISVAEERAKEAETVKAQFADVENQLEQTKDDLSVAQGDNAKLLKKVEEENKRVKIAENDIVQLRSALEAAELKLAERDAEITSLRETQNPLRMSLSGNDIVEELHVRVRELEEECAEKELQQIALKDRLERLDSTGSDLDLGLGSPKSSSPPSAMRRRTSTEKLIDSLQDSDDSDDAEDIMTFLKNPSAKKKKNGIVSPENEKRKTSKTETDDEKRANSAAAAAATTVSTPPAIGSLRDEFAALGENVESEYDSLSDESDNDDDDDGYEDAVLELLKDDETKSTKTAKKEDKTTTAEGKNGGGGVSVFVTKFDYNPNADSPNDNPETELSLKRGEFVYVYGDVDDDGFYQGETEDGRKGLVPSNFINRVPVDSPVTSPSPPASDDELTVKRVFSPAYQLNSAELDTVEEEDEDALNESQKDVSVVTLDESMLREEEKESVAIPPPSGLKIEREFARSLLIKWTAPTSVPPKAIHAYHVYIDGALKTKTTGNVKHRALVEGLDFLSGKMKLTVRSVTDRGESADSDFLLIGKAPLPPPADVKVGVTRDGQRALDVSWRPVSQSSCPESRLTGFKVYIDDVTATQVYDPKSTSVTINQFTISTLYTANPHSVRVTTTSVDGESEKSAPVSFSDALLKETAEEERIGGDKEKEEPSVADADESELTTTSDGGDDIDVFQLHAKKAAAAAAAAMSNGHARVKPATADSTKPAALINMFQMIDNEEKDEEDDDDEELTDEEVVEVFASPVRPSISPSSASNSIEVKEKFEIVAVVESSSSSSPKKAIADDVPRRFVALFNYDPSVMSPNDDGVDEELSFQKGDIILISGEKDEDGFYSGELNGRKGLVPYNMISELADSGCVIEETSVASNLSTPSPIGGELVADDLGRPMIALYDYDPAEMSPNPDAEVELDFKAGELVYVIGDVDGDGFYQGQKASGERGLVPSNFLASAAEGENLNADLLSSREVEEGKNGTKSSPSSPLDGASTSSTQRKKKKGLLTKGKKLVRRIVGPLGRSKNK
ncbi:RIMS-binding protein 3-like isoform X2 [Oscarella lobularis]|uniref:RIMS-binding protein 3-like isoform X2 n=1 Tax=Oscarella lobularis TaxID=121494 RepID=UPI00331429E0